VEPLKALLVLQEQVQDFRKMPQENVRVYLA